MQDEQIKEIAQTVRLSSKFVLFHANNLLDQEFLQNGNFSPVYEYGSITKALHNVVQMIRLTLTGQDIRIKLNHTNIRSLYPLLSFDKRRL